jgi:hypothetical protein
LNRTINAVSLSPTTELLRMGAAADGNAWLKAAISVATTRYNARRKATGLTAATYVLAGGRSSSLGVLRARLGQAVFAQQAAELVIAQAEKSSRHGLLELGTFESASQQVRLILRDGIAKIRW